MHLCFAEMLTDPGSGFILKRAVWVNTDWSIQTLSRFKEAPGVFQVGDSGGLHHDSPAALGQSEAVHWEHRGSGSGGQGAGPGESAVTEPHRQHDNTRKYPRTYDFF